MRGISLILVLLSGSVWGMDSCADLAGMYRCKDLTGKYVTVKVEQEGNEFYLDGVEPLDRVIADGNRHEVTNGRDYRNASYVAQCQDQGVTARGNGDIVQNGWPMGTAKFNLSLEKLKDGGLKISVDGSIRGPLGSLPIRESRKCVIVQ